MVASTQHDRFVEQDYARLQTFAMRTVREGLRWHLIEPAAGVRDFSSALPMIQAAQRHGIQIIWDLFHFGWPDHLDIFTPEWVKAFTELAFDFCRILKREMSQIPYIAPLNEISFVAWAGGDVAYLNPFCRGRGSELKKQLARAAIGASAAIQSELPQARLVSPEPVIHIAGDPARPSDVREAEAYRLSMFEAWDMISGRLDPELGGQDSYLDIIGVNYYGRNQWWNFGKTIWRGDPIYRPFHHILKEVFERYGRPMFVSETGAENEGRPDWFAYIFSEVEKAIRAGVPVHGICIYPILNHPGWDDDRHCYNGLWDYAGPDGSRECYRPFAEQIYRCLDTRSEQFYEHQKQTF